MEKPALVETLSAMQAVWAMGFPKRIDSGSRMKARMSFCQRGSTSVRYATSKPLCSMQAKSVRSSIMDQTG